MTSNRRRIHRMAGVVGHGLGERRSDNLPDACLAPSSEALIDRHPLPVFLRHIAPRRAGADAPENAIDDHTVVESRTALAPALGRQKSSQKPPFGFAQIAATQSCLPPRGILESISES